MRAGQSWPVSCFRKRLHRRPVPFKDAAVTAPDTLLLIELAEVFLRYVRTVKLASYAEAGSWSTGYRCRRRGDRGVPGAGRRIPQGRERDRRGRRQPRRLPDARLTVAEIFA